MRRRLGTRFVIVLGALAAGMTAFDVVAAFADDGTVLVGTATTPYGMTPRSYSVSGSLVRSDSGSTETVTDTATGAVIMIDHDRREFSETTAAEMAAFMNSVLAGPAKPSAAKASRARVVRTGRRRAIAGHAAEEVKATSGQLTVSAWVDPDASPQPALVEALRIAYSALGRGGQQVADMLEAANADPGMLVGFEVKGRIPGVFGEDVTVELSDLGAEPLPADEFQVPSGYRRVPSPYRRVNASPPPSYSSPVIPR